MYRLTILYGMPDDPDHFREYYLTRHIPLARRMRGLTGWNLSWIDRDAADPGPYLLIAELYAESRQAMDAILASPAGVAAREDVARFATGSVEMLFGAEEEVVLT